MSDNGYEGWAILELMGHRRLAGKVTEVEIAGSAMLRLDVFGTTLDTALATQFYGAQAIYCLTPSTEELCRRLGDTSTPMPVAPYELPSPPPAEVSRDSDDRRGDPIDCDYKVTDDETDDVLHLY